MRPIWRPPSTIYNFDYGRGGSKCEGHAKTRLPCATLIDGYRGGVEIKMKLEREKERKEYINRIK